MRKVASFTLALFIMVLTIPIAHACEAFFNVDSQQLSIDKLIVAGKHQTPKAGTAILRLDLPNAKIVTASFEQDEHWQPPNCLGSHFSPLDPVTAFVCGHDPDH
jgi:hypothetical protein